MAFHVACPITCRRICFCPLGFPRGTNTGAFLDDVKRIEELLRDPEAVRAPKGKTVQVLVPKVAPPPTPITIHLAAPPPPPAVAFGCGSLQQWPGVVVVGDEDGDGEQAEEASAQTKRVALQRKADAAKVAAEDYARKFEAGDVVVATKDDTADEQGVSNTNVFCRMCFVGEKEGNERARRMLSCKVCSKKYHRSCLKSWAQNRDLFHWSSWTCPSCRTCEICQKVGDPSKFMFCRRCDGAYHCYCQHPPHKNVSSGPYLCPKHTRCHSCGSNVPGNGLSVRWFLGYTCCDACGRLFVKGNYCPVCLKVYRDSESTPMVCCDTCQRWVHCHCDNISDQKYLQFQVDGNLQYKCATCRGECYQVKDLEDAVQELWRRRDEADQGLIASLRAAAGLPTQEEIFLISPFSDDEDSGPGTLKNEVGHSLKLSLKGFGESPKKSKDSGKKLGKKKNAKKKKGFSSGDKADQEHNKTEYDGQSFGDGKDNIIQSHKKGGVSVVSSSVAGVVNLGEGVGSINQPAVLKHKLVDEVMVSDGERTSRIVKIKSKRPRDMDSGDDTELNSQSKTVKAKKLVINLGPRKINVSNSPLSDTSSGRREQDLTTSNGSGDVGNRLMVNAEDGDAKSNDGYADNNSNKIIAKYARREGSLIKFGRTKPESSNLNPKTVRGSSSEGFESIAPASKSAPSAKRSRDSSRSTIGPASDVPSTGSSKIPLGKQSEGKLDTSAERNDDAGETPVLQSSAKDSKFSIKLKIKKPSLENQNNQGQLVEEEKSSIRGQRSKRKRSSSFMDKSFLKEDSGVPSHHDSEMMEDSWILKRLGKDAIGKRVEVYQPSDVSWHRGVVSEFTEGTSALSVTLDDGRVKALELGKQPIRFVPQKQKRSGL